MNSGITTFTLIHVVLFVWLGWAAVKGLRAEAVAIA